MQVSHKPAAVSVSFDEPNLVSSSALLPVMMLARDAGLHGPANQRRDDHVQLLGHAGNKLATQLGTALWEVHSTVANTIRTPPAKKNCWQPPKSTEPCTRWPFTPPCDRVDATPDPKQQVSGPKQAKRWKERVGTSIGFDELMPKTIATATVDGLLHHAHLCQTIGESVWLMQAQSGIGSLRLS